MKTRILFFIATWGAVGVWAQITNGGFENWTTMGNYAQLDGWATMNPICAGPFYSVTKSTDHYPSNVGSYSVRIENNTTLTQATGGWGIIATEAFVWPPKPAFPINGNPEKICGFYKFQSQNGDTAVVNLIIFNQGAVVGNTTKAYLRDKGSSWEDFCEDLDYGSYTGPIDSGFIMVFAYIGHSPTDPPNGNSVLYLDNLNFDEAIGVEEEQIEVGFTLFPNPANEFVTVQIAEQNTESAELRIFNLQGSLVLYQSLSLGDTRISIGNLPNGVYVAEVVLNGLVNRTRLILNN